MNPLEQQFQSLTDKLQLLLRQQARLQKENEQLQIELAACRQAEETQKAQVASLEQRIAVLQYAAGELPEAEKKAFEKRINSYIRDIDKMIAYLSK